MAATLPGGISAEQGGCNGVFTLGSGAAGADDPQFDQQMHLPMNAMWPQGPVRAVVVRVAAGRAGTAHRPARQRQHGR